MKKLVIIGIMVGVLSLGISNMVFATNIVTYKYTIDGADLMNYVVASGLDGSTAKDNGIFDGARLYRTINSRSFIASQNGAFQTWTTTTTDRLVGFNLWGYDGKGANWGEIYKVYDWPNTPTSSDANWSSYVDPWPWGSFDDYANSKPGYGSHYNNGELLGWYTDYSNGLGFGAGSKPSFSFTMTLDLDDAAFGASSPWYNAQEGQMVFWFGGSMANQEGFDTGIYEGNIVLQGSPVPEPTSILLFGTGLVGLALAGWRRRKL